MNVNWYLNTAVSRQQTQLLMDTLNKYVYLDCVCKQLILRHLNEI